MVIDRKKIVRAKLEKLKQGYSAYCESQAVAEMLDKEIANLNLKVYVDRTPVGNWYIPIKEEKKERRKSAN